MAALSTFSSAGFSVTATNAIDYLAGTQAAGAGMVSANVRDLATTMHTDLGRVSQQIGAQTAQLAGINTEGFRSIGEKLQKGFGSLETLSGVSIAVQAAGFAVVATQLGKLRGDVRALHADMVRQGEELIGLQRIANAGIESLVDFAERQLKTQEKILEALVSSRTIEAQQLIRQGWDNLKNGYEADAFERFKRSLDFDNTVYISHAELGRILESRSDLAAAEDHLVRATKFASGAGPQIEGFAHVQLAGFYERRRRLDDAVMHVREALRRDDSAAWRFYLCELLATAERGDEALTLLPTVINADARFHVLAAGSTALEKLQPSLTRVLVELDVQRRSAALAALAPIGNAVKALEALGADEGTVSTARANGSAILHQLLTRPFVDLEPLGERSLEAVGQTTARIDAVGEHAVGQVDALRSSVASELTRTPQAIEPIQVGAVISTIKAIVSLVIATGMGLITTDLLSSDADSNRGVGFLMLFVAVVLAVLGVAYIRERASILAKHQVALKPLRDAWTVWRDLAVEHAEGVSTQRETVAARLRAALDLVRTPRLESALARVQSISSPRVPTAPPWVRYLA